MPRTKSIVMIDCQVAGVSGDMFLGALIDLGADTKKIIRAIKSLQSPSTGYKDVIIEIRKIEKGGFKATKIDITAQTKSGMKGEDLIRIVENSASNLNLSKEAREFASKSIKTIVNTEASIHGEDLGNVHVHEMGEIDTAAEIIGCAVALEDLKLFDAKIYSTPVSVGGGLIKFSHGTVTSPAPATLAIFQSRNFPIQGGPIEAELSTPTGASILTNLVQEVNVFYPLMKPFKIGYGAGSKNFKKTPNILRITIGETINEGFFNDTVAVLETNIDDATGETIGYTIDRLLKAGAKDVSIIPMSTKKSRPGQIIKIIADQNDIQQLASIIADETGSLGTRLSISQRIVLDRETIKINVPIGSGTEQIGFKIARNSRGAIVRIKPEYEDLKRIAEKTRKPLRELSETATARAREKLQGKTD
jgi:pyridinium-3,5-bisthiocarboxylic acid mononucleotide nickel chelatase